MPTPPPHIVVVGSANVDLTTFTDGFPRPGETIFGRKFDLGFGGKGANQAVAARLCGARVSMVARVGSDLFGPASIRNFEALGIDVSQVKIVEGVASGVAPIFVDESGENRIIVVKGANDCLDEAAVDAAADVLRNADCIVMQLEIPIETVYYTVAFAKKHGIRCILNPAPAAAIDLTRLSTLDYFIPNESEAKSITGLVIPKDSAEALLKAGLPRVIVTLGDDGALVAGDGDMDFVPAFKVNTIDTTGAGDAFVGSFATFIAEGRPEHEALSLANLYAALSTTRVGTQKSFRTRAEFEAEL